MADALKVELRMLGIDKSVSDMRRVASEMKQLRDGLGESGRASSGSRGGGSAAASAAVARRQQKQESDAIKNRYGSGPDIAKIINSSRVAMKSGGGLEIMPLVGQVSRLFGEFAVPIAVAVTAIEAFGAAAQSASEDLHHFRDAQNIGGGTAGETSQGAAIGRQFGIGSEDFANDARRFNEKISTDPWAGAYAGQHGIRAQPEPFGDPDKMTNLLKELDHLRSIRSDSEARREAYATGTEKYLGVRDISDTNWNNTKAISNINAQGMSPEEVRADANRRAARQNMQDLGAGIWNNLGRTINKDVDWIIGRIMPRSIREAHDRNLHEGGPSDTRATTAMEQHTAAMQAHTLAMQNYGIYGGGDRTHGAVPGAYLPSGVRKPEWAEKQIRANAAALGAFAL